MAPPKSTSATATDSPIDLLAIDGPGEGIRVSLSRENKLQIGRGLRGLEVPDPHVSLQHAVLEWDGEYFAITDLGSQKGTRVGEARIPPHEPVRLTTGSKFTVGSTVFVLVERHRRLQRAAEIVLMVSLAFLAVVGVLFAFAPRADAEFALLWKEEIRQGALRNRELGIDVAYVRQRGLDPRAIRIRRVTDANQDGVDEVWFQAEDREYVVTFEPSGRWVDLGQLPIGCADVRNSGEDGLPMLQCGAVSWVYREGGLYEALGQDGVVIWGVPTDTWKGPGPPPAELVKAWRGTLRRETSLAGFLAANGVDQGIHYLICENALPSVPPVVLMEDGQLRTLSIGCRSGLQFGGDGIAAVRAVAFTVAGHRALIDDLETTLSGAVDGIFRAPALDALATAWHAEPDGMGARWVSFEGQNHFFAPVAKDVPVRRNRVLSSAADPVPERSVTHTVVGTGVVRLDPPGCADLEVKTGQWTCPIAQGCLSGTTFLEVRDVGCGPGKTVIQGTYAGGVFDAVVGDQQVRVVLDAVQLDNRTDVKRARVAWRLATGG